MDNPVQEAAAKSAVQLMLRLAQSLDQHDKISVEIVTSLLRLAFLDGVTWAGNQNLRAIERLALLHLPTSAVAS